MTSMEGNGYEGDIMAIGEVADSKQASHKFRSDTVLHLKWVISLQMKYAHP